MSVFFICKLAGLLNSFDNSDYLHNLLHTYITISIISLQGIALLSLNTLVVGSINLANISDLKIATIDVKSEKLLHINISDITQ